MNDLLRVEGLRVAFAMQAHPLEVVRGVSFRVRAGSVVAIVGESGSGKSVTAQAIMGLLPRSGAITGGRILFADPRTPETQIDIAALHRDSSDMRALRGSRMTMIFQEPMSSLSPLHTIGNQISEALTTHVKTSSKDARAATEETLRLVNFPDPARAFDMYPFELSGGLRQRAMIAMAIICKPALLIADEPTTALDVTIQAQVLSLLKSLQAQLGMAVLLITHDLGVVANMADEILVMYGGEIMEAGPADAIFRRPKHLYLKALIKAIPHFDMKPGERLVSLRDAVGTAPIMQAAVKPRSKVPPGEPVLVVKAVTKSYFSAKGRWFGRGERRRAVAVDNVSFDIRRGECLGLVGESGCGKTTMSKLIMRALTPDSGQIVFRDGERDLDIAQLQGSQLADFRTRIQMVFQDPVSSLSPRMTVLNIVREPLEIHGRGSRAKQKERVVQLMNVVGLDPRFLNRYPHSFSGGQRQRIGIARALALEPDLLICDEPVSALDVSVQAQILNLLVDLKTQLGLTYLFISHNLAVVDYIADRIAVMARGRIVEIAPREVLFRRPVHPYTRTLLKAVPYPDLDRPLDFASLDGAADDSAWEPQFRSDTGGTGLRPIDLGDGHTVLANANANARELAA